MRGIALAAACLIALVATLTCAASAQQPSDYVLVISYDSSGGGQSLSAFDRRLDLVA